METLKKLCAVAVVAVACVLPAKADLLLNTTNQNKVTEYSLPGTLAASATTNLYTSGGVFLVNPGYGVGVDASWTNAGSGSLSNVAFYLYITVDGSNYTTAPLVSLFKTSNGATAVRAYTNFVSTLFDSAFGVGLMVSNGDSANVIGFTDRKVRLTRKQIPAKSP